MIMYQENTYVMLNECEMLDEEHSGRETLSHIHTHTRTHTYICIHTQTHTHTHTKEEQVAAINLNNATLSV